MLVFWVVEGNDVEANMEIGVGRIEIYNIFDPVVGNQMQYIFDKLAVRVNHTDTLAVVDVLRY